MAESKSSGLDKLATACATGMHDALKPFSWLLGKWIGTGKGSYPSINDFTYNEEIIFEQHGQPLFNYRSITRNDNCGKVMHQETGFLKVHPPSGKIEFMICQNAGIMEIEEGESTQTKLKLHSTKLERVSFAKPPYVTKVERSYELLDDGQLHLIINMATTTTELEKHLEIKYKRHVTI